MIIIKKIMIYIIIFLLVFNTVFFAKPQQSHAIGVVGSSALKQAVVGSWEKAGVTFANKTAKDKAFDRWQMSTYNKWKADEAAGKNADLWAHYNAIVQGEVAPFTKNPVADMNGVSRMLVDSTLFGLAITVGAEIGYEIQNAQQNKTFLENLSASPPQDLDGVDLMSMTNYWKESAVNGRWYQMLLNYKDSGFHFIASSPIAGEPNIIITKIEARSDRYLVHIAYTAREWGGEPNNGTTILSNYDVKNFLKRDPDTGGYKYTFTPSVDDLPGGVPHHVTTEPWPAIPEIIPKPVEILVPNGDEMWEGTLNIPFGDDFPIPPDPGTDPGKDPGTDPGKDPG
ncbi:hypothetical protein P4604_16575, partial [Lysinibacillus capsici]|uniref:hypothetical protein n=1 Tax=Lysinibacillus capsici TaxID=2115968 RepID=UPI002E2328B7|nr:hypothetical protein [Lysinibacillus capsici]